MPLVQEKVISKAMSRKIAGSGLNIYILKLIYAIGGLASVKRILSEKNKQKKARVTVPKKVF